MHEIKLAVDDKNLETVVTILKNLKVGLIGNIEINGTKAVQTTQYKPKINTIIKEENSATADRSGKYASAAVYKQKLKKRS